MATQAIQPPRQLMQHIFAELAQGDGQAFRDSLADDFCWTVPGTNTWSGTCRGKEAVARPGGGRPAQGSDRVHGRRAGRRGAGAPGGLAVGGGATGC